MKKGVMQRVALLAAIGVSVVATGHSAVVDDSTSETIPPEFVAFEHMIGAWKGTGIPKANRLKGWPESHLWAWRFAKGVPLGMSVELKGDKALSKAELRYDGRTKTYRLDGADPQGKPVSYTGRFDAKARVLVLDRTGSAPEGKERVSIRPNSNRIRYIMLFDRQEPGAPQYKTVIEVGLTKEGEAFASGGGSADLPKCIVTGGAATLSVTFEGKSYPLCCTGCRDEFNDNPAKYVKKALLRAQAGTKKSAQTVTRGRGDSEFDGLVEEPKAKPSKKDM
jgi:YHS domain-containing protein